MADACTPVPPPNLLIEKYTGKVHYACGLCILLKYQFNGFFDFTLKEMYVGSMVSSKEYIWRNIESMLMSYKTKLEVNNNKLAYSSSKNYIKTVGNVRKSTEKQIYQYHVCTNVNNIYMVTFMTLIH